MFSARAVQGAARGARRPRSVGDRGDRADRRRPPDLSPGPPDERHRSAERRDRLLRGAAHAAGTDDHRHARPRARRRRAVRSARRRRERDLGAPRRSSSSARTSRSRTSRRDGQIGVYGPSGSGDLRAGSTAATADASAASSTRVAKRAASTVIVVADRRLGIPGFDVFVERPRRRRSRSARARPACRGRATTSRSCASKLDGRAFGVDMDDDTIPLEAGIEDRAISLTKGCYVGQEVIIRVLTAVTDGWRGAWSASTLRDGRGRCRAPRRSALMRRGPRRRRGHQPRVFAGARPRPIALGYVHRDFVGAGTRVRCPSTRRVTWPTTGALSRALPIQSPPSHAR